MLVRLSFVLTMVSARGTLRLCVAAAWMSLTISSVMVSAEMTIAPSFSPQLYIDDNRRQRESNPASVIASINEASLDAEYQQETYSINLEPKVRVSRYTQESILNSDDYFVAMDAQKFWSRTQAQLAFDYENESTITTELFDSGRFDNNIRRETIALNGFVSYAISPDLIGSFSAGISDVTFEETEGGNFTDFRSYFARADLNYALGPRTTLIPALGYALFKTPDSGGETRSYTFELGIAHELDNTLDVLVSAGPSVSHIDSVATEQFIVSLNPFVIGTRLVETEARGSGEVIRVVVNKRFERAQATAEWNRSFSPSSQGARQRLEIVRSRAEYRFTEDLKAKAFFIYRSRTQEATPNALFRDLDIIQASATLEYRFSKTQVVELGYRFRNQSEPNGDYSANSNRIFLTYRFDGEAFAF